MARRVFVSFVEEDLNLVNLFRGQARNQNNDLEFLDYSVRQPFNSPNADYIKKQISDLIHKVSVTTCLIGYTTHTSRWVDWELEKAEELGKGIVGVRLHNAFQDFPPAIFNFDHEVVNWNIRQIVTAIESAAIKAGY